jgi:hypothetical protein
MIEIEKTLEVIPLTDPEVKPVVVTTIADVKLEPVS